MLGERSTIFIIYSTQKAGLQIQCLSRVGSGSGFSLRSDPDSVSLEVRIENRIRVNSSRIRIQAMIFPNKLSITLTERKDKGQLY